MTTPIEQIINYANLYQDVELASAISALKNAGQITSFIQGQQSRVYNDIVKQKEDTFAKVYGDLSRASKAQEAILLYNKRTKQLADVQNQIYDNQKNSADAIMNDQSMANRKTEMNEWSVNNKKDTLFIYSTMFIMFASLLLLTGLLRLGLISSSLWVGIAVCLVIVFALIFANRYYYTTVLRNKRFWNKQVFEGKYGKIPVPLCPNVEQAIADMPNTVNQLQNNVRSGIATNMINATQSIASGAQSVANQVQRDMSVYQTR